MCSVTSAFLLINEKILKNFLAKVLETCIATVSSTNNVHRIYKHLTVQTKLNYNSARLSGTKSLRKLTNFVSKHKRAKLLPFLYNIIVKKENSAPISFLQQPAQSTDNRGKRTKKKIVLRCCMLPSEFNLHTYLRKTFTPISVRLFWSNFHEWRMSSFCFFVSKKLVTIGASPWDFFLETDEAAHPIVKDSLCCWMCRRYSNQFASCEIGWASSIAYFKDLDGNIGSLLVDSFSV